MIVSAVYQHKGMKNYPLLGIAAPTEFAYFYMLIRIGLNKNSIATSIIIADAQPVYRMGMKALLSEQQHITVKADVGNIADLSAEIQHSIPDMLMLDYHPDYFDEEGMLKALERIPDCKVVLLCSTDRALDMYRTLSFKPSAFVIKETHTEAIFRAITAVRQNEKYYCSYITSMIMKEQMAGDQFRPVALSPREIEVAQLIAQGRMNAEIADQLHLSPHTIHSHRKRIMKKLNIHSALELARYMHVHGLAD